LAVRHDLAVDQAIAGRRDVHLIAGHHEAVALAATPFACPVAVRAARDPAVVGKSLRGDRREHADDEQPSQRANEESSQQSGHGKASLSVPARRLFGSADLLPRSLACTLPPQERIGNAYRGSPLFAPATRAACDSMKRVRRRAAYKNPPR